MAEEFRQIGGARVGASIWWALNATFPFASLKANSGAITLSVLGTLYVFPPNAITRLSRYRGLFSQGLQIEHTVDGYPRLVVFWSLNFGALKRQLAELGYQIG